MSNATVSTAVATVFTSLVLVGCATPTAEVPSSLGAVDYMSQAAVSEYVTGNTEEYSKGAGYTTCNDFNHKRVASQSIFFSDSLPHLCRTVITSAGHASRAM